MRVSLFDFHLPLSRIASKPAKPRDHAKLLIVSRKNGRLRHRRFDDLVGFLADGDVLVLNNSKVIKARLRGRKDTGGVMEVFLLRHVRGAQWEVLMRGHGARAGRVIRFRSGLSCEVIKRNEDVWIVEFNQSGAKFAQTIARIGEVPLPPYIKKRSRLSDYQTVYAEATGSVAAPTAGLHFTKRLLARLKRRGVQIEYVTLHVGLGTFRPVKTARVEDHPIHSEWASVSSDTARRLNSAKREGRRIIAVGTTSVRTLEGFTSPRGCVAFGSKDIRIFIYPGYRFRSVDAMITNFHLPKSSLLMLVSAFAGRTRMLAAYRTAIRNNYRFYSFGDAMFIA